jgi:hypothetical protein
MRRASDSRRVWVALPRFATLLVRRGATLARDRMRRRRFPLDAVMRIDAAFATAFVALARRHRTMRDKPH